MRKLEQFNSETKEPEKEIGLTLDEKGKLQEEGEKIYAEKFVEKLQDVLDHEFESKDGKEKIILRDIVDKYLPKFTEPGFFDLPQEKQSELQKEFVQELISQISKIPEGKWSMDFKKAVETGKMNCSNCATLTGLILKEAGFKNVEYGTPAGHATNIVSFSNGRTYFADSRNGIFEDLDVDKDTTSEDREGVKVYKTKKPEVFWEIIPVMPQKEGAVASYLENLNAAYNHKADDFYPDFKEVYSPEETEEIKREYLRLGRIKNLFGGKISRYYGTTEFREEEKRLENTAFIEEIIDHPLVRVGLGIYRKFADIYFNVNGEAKKAEIKKRADEIFSEDEIYRGILENEKFLESVEFKKIVARRLEQDFKKEDIEKLKKIRKEGKKDEFGEILRRIIINRQVDRDMMKVEKNGEEIGSKCRSIGYMWVEIVGKECRLHLPRISAGKKEEVEKNLRESMFSLSELLQRDEFKYVETITGISTVMANKKVSERYELVRMHTYMPEEIIDFQKNNPDVYRETQNTGIKESGDLLENYLLRGERPKVEGRWIKKEEFINQTKNFK